MSEDARAPPLANGTDADHRAAGQRRQLRARHEGRVVFVRYALPGETVKVRVVSDHGSYWHADVVEVIEPSADRVDPLCPIAGVDGAGCCDLAFAEPDAAAG